MRSQMANGDSDEGLCFYDTITIFVQLTIPGNQGSSDNHTIPKLSMWCYSRVEIRKEQ